MKRSRGSKATSRREVQSGKSPPARGDQARGAAGGRRGAGRPASDAPAAARRDGAGAGLESIREILFGDSLRLIDSELQRQEERTITAIQELREDMRRHDQALEAWAKHEFDNSSKRMTEEAAARAEAANGLRDELKEVGARAEKRDAQLEEAQTESIRALREQLLAESRELMERQRQWRDEILATLAEGLEKLRASETDRVTLANMLSEMSSRLASGAPSTSTVH